MASGPAPRDARPTGKVARSLIPPPAASAPPALPSEEPRAPGPSRGRRAGWAVAAVLALAAAFLGGWLVPDGQAMDPYDFGVDGRGRGYDPYWIGPVIIVDAREYHHYLNVSVRPTLVTVSASFTGAACEAIAQDEDGLVERLMEAKDAAKQALAENLRVTPPPQFERLHTTVRQVFEHTASTVDTLAGCAQAGDAACPEGQQELVKLLDDAGALTQEVKQVVTGLPATAGL